MLTNCLNPEVQLKQRNLWDKLERLSVFQSSFEMLYLVVDKHGDQLTVVALDTANRLRIVEDKAGFRTQTVRFGEIEIVRVLSVVPPSPWDSSARLEEITDLGFLKQKVDFPI